MQVTADVMGMPIRVVASDQACALGAGMLAAVAAGIYPRSPPRRKRWERVRQDIQTRTASGRALREALREVRRPRRGPGGIPEDAMTATSDKKSLLRLRSRCTRPTSARGAWPRRLHLRQRLGYRPRSSGLIAIKPSGVEYADLTPKNIVVLDLQEGRWRETEPLLGHEDPRAAVPRVPRHRGGGAHPFAARHRMGAGAPRPPCFGTTHADYFPRRCALHGGHLRPADRAGLRGRDRRADPRRVSLDRLPRDAGGPRRIPWTIHLGKGRRGGCLPRLDAGLCSRDGHPHGSESTRASRA